MLKISCLTIILLITQCAHAQIQPLRIALVAPFKGPYSSYGTLLLSGATQAVNDLNHSDTLRGISLEITPIDDQCNPDVALAVAAKIIKDKNFQAVIGHACSACALATSRLYAQANILVINPSATNSHLTEQHVPTMFRMAGNDIQQAQVAANFIANKLRSEKIAILHDRELYSKHLADLISENLTHLGKTPVLYQAVPRGSKNFDSLVKKLQSLKADAIYFPGLYPEVGGLAHALSKAHLQIPLIAGDAIALNKFASAAGDQQIAKSVMMTFSTDPKRLLSSKKVIYNMQKNNLETNGYSLYAYASVQVIAQAISNTNSLDNKILANWLHQHEVQTVLGKKSWDTNGDIVDNDFKVYSWDDNDYNVLF